MRLAAVAFLVAALAGPAVAQESIADQAQAAFAVFAGGKSQADFNTAGYGTTALSNVTGDWVSLGGPAAGTGIETYGADTERACESNAVLALASPNPITMTLSAKPVETAFSQTYTLVAGSTFSEYTDPAEYFAAIGLGPERTGPEADQRRALALSLANGIVQIYRPSEDILVITRDKAYPTVLARCPA
jgi:hypothetical protein